MEIRQVLKSSASMIPDLFYKVSGETREMEKNRDSGGKGWKERRMSQREELRRRKQSVEADVGRRGKKPTNLERRDEQERQEEREDRR